MFRYAYNAEFISTLFNAAVLNTAVRNAVAVFNALPRKRGHKKHIGVRVDPTQKCLEIVLVSDTQLAPINYLRAVQFFSKTLASQPGMGSYVVRGRLLVQ